MKFGKVQSNNLRILSNNYGSIDSKITGNLFGAYNRTRSDYKFSSGKSKTSKSKTNVKRNVWERSSLLLT